MTTSLNPMGFTFNLDQTDHLLSTTRAVRKRLDLTRPVPRELLIDCVRLAAQAPARRAGGKRVVSRSAGTRTASANARV